MQKITTFLMLLFFPITNAQEVTTLTIDDKGKFVLTIPYLEFETDKGKQAFTAKLHSSTTATFTVDFESVKEITLQEENGSANNFPTTHAECEVLNIYDGDTMTLQCPGETEKTKVRLYCIDTPEMKQEPWGTQARDYLRSITENTVKLVSLDVDRYGRIVGEVYNDNVSLNLAQVKARQAAVYDAFCEDSEYKEAEKEARDAKFGIWSEQGLQQTPWKWRE